MKYERTGPFKVEEEILKQIQEIDKHLVILAITGLYRTGKSYLMNRLANSSNGFPLGKTIESKTKAIWIWCKDHPLKDNTVLVLLDTEGLGDVSKHGHDSTTIKYNRPRECIRKYFCKRKCFVFDRPGGRRVLQQLECIPLEEMSNEFIEETNLFFRLHVRMREQVFSTPIEIYVNAIRDGAVPDVDDAFMAVANLENERMAAVAIKEFAEKIKMIELPVLKTNDFENLYQEIQRGALSKLRHESVFNSEKYEKHAVADMNSMWEEMKKENRKMVRLHCEQIIQKIFYRNQNEKKLLQQTWLLSIIQARYR
ncbi:guanylate-binding protein 1-like [Ruditapes philippinarum]|uniref:guanylate-binding protein 1-like n=1 Tax=Ruditapes philippinarum TaxID=129788 RepID=UPI00295AF136|nr:guanylate-binding protein 1-like [Ruditapes philippinarum]